MQTIQHEVTEEEAKKWNDKILADGKGEAEKERFSESIRWGYGLYGWYFFKDEEGKWYEVYHIGDSCD